VAGFIGSPAMNLMEGQLSGGTFTGENVSVSGLSGPDGPVTLGFRAEDAGLASADGEINAPVYTIELLGDATMLTVKAGGAMVSVKAGKEYRTDIGAPVALSVPAEICHLFDAETGQALSS